jgi:hypothetical protein
MDMLRMSMSGTALPFRDSAMAVPPKAVSEKLRSGFASGTAQKQRDRALGVILFSPEML